MFKLSKRWKMVSAVGYGVLYYAFAVLLTAAAASGSLPTLGGAAPTLVVSVREEDLARATAVIAASDLHSGDEDELPEPASKCLSCGATMPEAGESSSVGRTT